MSNDPSARAAGIEFRGVVKRYDRHGPAAVDGIDFVVPRGSLTTLLGPSGCGKTTTLRMIAGLESPSAGAILIDGREVTALGPAERNVSMVFQSYALFPHMSVLDNVAYGLIVSGLARAEAADRARSTLATVGLSGLDTRLPSELSGGQQQRVAVARALVLEPSVLLFDEPLSNLDARLRRSMRDEIRSLQQRLGLTVAYVTHDQGEALAVSDHIIVMNAGRIAQQGTPKQLYEQPQSEFVAGFMGEALLLPAELRSDGRVQLGPLVFTPAASSGCEPGTVRAAIRPEAWQIDADGPNECCGLTATVDRCAYLGNLFEVTLTTELGAVFVLAPATGHRAWTQGQVVWLGLSGHGVALLPSA